MLLNYLANKYKVQDLITLTEKNMDEHENRYRNLEIDSKVKKKTLIEEKFIGAVCGSVSVFFLIIGWNFK